MARNQSDSLHVRLRLIAEWRRTRLSFFTEPDRFVLWIHVIMPLGCGDLRSVDLLNSVQSVSGVYGIYVGLSVRILVRVRDLR